MAKAVALYLGTLLRLTGKAQRGIGSIRQDTNLSIKDGARVEIKGMQELDTDGQVHRERGAAPAEAARDKVSADKGEGKVGSTASMSRAYSQTRTPR